MPRTFVYARSFNEYAAYYFEMDSFPTIEQAREFVHSFIGEDVPTVEVIDGSFRDGASKISIVGKCPEFTHFLLTEQPITNREVGTNEYEIVHLAETICFRKENPWIA